jgi:anaerobic dimethyl sulfoxide reductase subunit C (anchor subunit)
LRNKDWSLVFFTLLSQLSVGIVLWLALLAVFFTGTSLSFETGFSPINPVSIALGLIVIATVSSFLHLGNPSNAPNALNNLSGSWL